MLNLAAISKARLQINKDDARLATAFKIFSDVNRIRIFRILTREPKMTIGNLAQILKISLPLASQHLKILEQAGFLQKERNGKKIIPVVAHHNPLATTMAVTINKLHSTLKKINIAV